MKVDTNSMPSRINWDAWIREIRDIGKTNPLTNFEVNDYGQIDLDRAHPNGIAQFTSTGSALLSNLVREPLAFSKALATARRIKAKTTVHERDFGIHTGYLVGGLASLEQDGFDYNLPIILWPINLLRKTDDFEVVRSGKPFVNPALVAALFDTYGVALDTAKLLDLVNSAIDLMPISVIDHIAQKLDEGSRVEFQRALIVGNFAIEPALIEQEIDVAGNTLLRRLAEVAEVPELSPDGLAEPRLVADADATQKRIVARAVRGDTFAVETLPGSGYTQTVVNTLAGLVHDGKKVLVVTPRRQTINELAERLASSNLAGLMVRSSSFWLDVVGAIARYEKAGEVDLVTAGVKREATAKHLGDYLNLLHTKSDSLGFTPMEILEALAGLASMPNAPTSTARISFNTLLATKDRSQAIELLERAEAQGMFQVGPEDSFWFDSRFDNSDQAEELLLLASDLAHHQFPALDAKVTEIIVQANFKMPTSFEELGEYLALMVSVARTLDRFVPEVFDVDVTELIEATSPRKFGGQISGSNRRRLKKLAKEYLRPGVSVGDLNSALVEIKAQGASWAGFSNDDARPSVVSGASDALVLYRNLATELARIQVHLAPTLAEKLPALKLDDFEKALSNLAETGATLKDLSAKAVIRTELTAAGLDSVFEDFAKIHVAKDHLASQFDQVWWQSAFEIALMDTPSLANYSSEQIEAIEEDFVGADRDLINNGVTAFNQLQAHHWRESLEANPSEGQALKEVLKTRDATVRAVFDAAPRLSGYLLAAIAASPYELPNLLADGQKFDTALILDASGTTIGENLSALGRVSQVVAFGDSAIAAPIGFELEASERPTKLEATSESAFDLVARIFGVESMRKNWRPTGQTLGSLINREFYQNRIIFEPTAGEYAGKSNFELHQVRSKTATSDAMAESPDQELEEAVKTVLQHAANHPEDSLMLVTASDLHAERLQSSLDEKVLELPALKQFFDAHGDEKFEVATLNRLSHRVADRVVFSPGFGVTSSGFASNSLGQLSESSGRRTLANLLVSARKSLTVVTAIPADKLPQEPVNAAKQFAKLFKYATAPMPVDSEIDSDPMLSDLALRLRKLGAHVTIGYTPRIPMVASFGSKSAVILPDWNLIGDDLSEKVRLRPALLAGMGWTTIRIHALEVFSDPQGLAVRIGDQLGMQISKKSQTLFDEPSFDETDAAWGEGLTSNDRSLKENKPPHWG
ncbi:MAG: hypothetical protein RL140_371 [Actinomycetota bacterium]|jgi:hypothetical protein